MPSNTLRATLLTGALLLLPLAGPVSSASAVVESSRITSPADPTYALYDAIAQAPKSTIFTIAGTTTGSGEVDIRCYYGANSYQPIEEKVAPVGNSFSVEVPADLLSNGPCVMRAVPTGDATPRPPGTADPFQGPRVVGSNFEVFTNPTSKDIYDYELRSNTLSGYFDFESVGDCALVNSSLYAPISLLESGHLFYCNAALFGENQPATGPSTRSELQIDGANAYGPTTAEFLSEKIEEEQEAKKEAVVPIAGVPQVTVTKTFDPASGLVTITEVDPIVKCSPAAAFPPTASSCTSFTSTGVQLERSWRTGTADQVASMTDTWHSTNGAAHSLSALYAQETFNGGKEGGAYEFPGTGSFAPIAKGQTVTLPAGAGAIYYKEDAQTPDTGDSEHPQGAIVYDTPPSGPLSVYRSSGPKADNGFEMPYQGTIPANGSYELRMGFIQAYTLSEVQSLAGAAISSYHPTLAIASPANGTTVSAPSVTVSGTASDAVALASLTVGGHAVGVGAGGAWSTSVALNRGTNTITAVATNQAGLSTEASVGVTYTPIPPVAHASEVGSVHGARGEVSFTIACTGAGGTSCEVQSALSTVEKTRGGRPVAVSARRHRRTRSEVVSVGSSSLTIPAGQRVTIAIQLNAVGKGLLSRFGGLPVHLTVTLVGVGQHTSIITENLVVTPPHRPRHRHHRHHRR